MPYRLQHDLAGECWCEPKKVFTAKYGTEVWVHNDPKGTDPPEEAVAAAVMEAMDNDDGGVVRVKPI